jgi:hypothetical protein
MLSGAALANLSRERGGRGLVDAGVASIKVEVKVCRCRRRRAFDLGGFVGVALRWRRIRFEAEVTSSRLRRSKGPRRICSSYENMYVITSRFTAISRVGLRKKMTGRDHTSVRRREWRTEGHSWQYKNTMVCTLVQPHSKQHNGIF